MQQRDRRNRKRSGSGIYAIIHTASGRRYIGSTDCFNIRWANHRITLRKNKHHCRYLQRAWNKYGEDAFEFVVLERSLPNSSLLCIREDEWLLRFKDLLFNTYYRPEPHPDVVMSQEERRARSIKMRGQKIRGKLNEDQVKDMIHRYASGESSSSLAKRFGIAERNVSTIVGRKWWSYVEIDPEIERICRERLDKAGKGSKNCNAKFTESDVVRILERLASGESQAAIARDYGVTNSAINCISKGKTWKHVPRPNPQEQSLGEDHKRAS